MGIYTFQFDYLPISSFPAFTISYNVSLYCVDYYFCTYYNFVLVFANFVIYPVRFVTTNCNDNFELMEVIFSAIHVKCAFRLKIDI